MNFQEMLLTETNVDNIVVTPQKNVNRKVIPIYVGARTTEEQLFFCHAVKSLGNAPVLISDGFVLSEPLPGFSLFKPPVFDLEEVKKRCTHYSVDEMLSILYFAQKNQRHEDYLWKRLEGKGNYLFFFGKDGLVYKWFIDGLGKLHPFVFYPGFMNQCYCDDFIVSGPGSKIASDRDRARRRTFVEKIFDEVIQLRSELN